MANGDMQARLLLDSKDFDKKIDKSKKQVKASAKKRIKLVKGVASLLAVSATAWAR